MAIIFQDNFTGSSGTNLDSHSPDTGTSWTKEFEAGGTINMQLDGSGNVDGGNGGISDGASYSANVTYNTANYEVEVTTTTVGTGDDSQHIGARCTWSGGSPYDGYYIYFSDSYFELIKVDNGSASLLDEDLSNWPSNGDSVKLVVNGSSIKGYINDTEYLSATDSAVTAAGEACLGMGYLFYTSDDMSSQADTSFSVNTLSTEYTKANTSKASITTIGLTRANSVKAMIAGNYSRGDEGTLPTGTADLETYYSPTDKTNIATDDGTRVGFTGTGYVLHQFKDEGTAPSYRISVTWNGQTNVAPSRSTVYLQVYNQDTTSWETKDSDFTTAADTDFTLEANITSSTSDYYDENNKVVWRVYQELT